MSNVQSYNALIDRFKAFASGHFILKTFSHGQIDTADLEKFTEYPFMHVVPSNVTYAKGTKTFSFQIVLADLPRDKDDKVEFQKEVLSDLQRIAEDLVAEITNHRMLFGDLITVQNVTLEPFLEEFHNTLTGWTVSLELLVPYYWDACSIPAEWNDFFESGSGGTGSILTFIDSITRDNNGNVSLVNDEATPAPNYYYGTNGAGVRGWYLTTDNIGLTCETIGDCQTIIDIEAAIDALEEEIVLKADISSISAVGFSNDYTDLDNLPTIPAAQVNSDWNATSGVAEILNKPTLTNGTVTSVGLIMPSAFSVANSPITSSGDIAVTGAGTVSQYVRGDGSLANFPTSTGGGASLSFYLNGSVAQGTFGGVAFKEMDRTPVFGAGTDFTINANGYIQSFITDANVPNLLEIPAGNWNFETYFSASSNGGSPSFYVELYKWDGATLSLIASNSATPEGITNGTAIDAYFSALAVPQTTLAATDRLAIRIYVTHSGRTIKLHTENSHLCQVITTFSTGLTALNGLTAQVQNFATGTSGTDFGISSATSTHTFNLPTASAANRGALSSADWSTFNSKVPATRSLTINGTTQDLSADRTFTIATGLTVGTTPITSGTIGRVLFEGTGNVLQQSANLFWDNTNLRLDVIGKISTQQATFPAFAANGSVMVGGSNVSAIAGVLLGVQIPYVSGAFGGHTIGYSNQTNPKWLIGISRNLPQENALVYYEDSAAASARLTIFPGGNVGINTTTDGGYKLDVSGNGIFRSGLQVNSVLSVNTIYPNQNQNLLISAAWADSTNVTISTITNKAQVLIVQPNANLTLASGTHDTQRITHTFAATSGTAVVNALTLQQTINQTGGANGITRGLYVNPTLTSAANFRAIETSVGNVMLNTTSGNTLIGTTTDAGFKLDVNGTSRVISSLLATHSVVSTTSSSYATVSVKTDGVGGFFRAYGGSFAVPSLANKASFGPDGANGIVIFSNPIANSGSSGSISLRGGGYDSAAEMLFIDSVGCKFTNGVVLIGTTTDVASSICTIESTTKGFLPPRMTTTQKNAIATPAAGLVVYDTTLNKLCVRTAAAWETITSL